MMTMIKMKQLITIYINNFSKIIFSMDYIIVYYSLKPRKFFLIRFPQHSSFKDVLQRTIPSKSKSDTRPS